MIGRDPTPHPLGEALIGARLGYPSGTPTIGFGTPIGHARPRKDPVNVRRGGSVKALPDTRTSDSLIEIATRFYLHGWTQAQIAREFGIDPSTVSRYLKRARDEGVVRVEIRPPRRHNIDLGRELAARYGLARAIVAPSEVDVSGALPAVAAVFLGGLLRSGMRVGIGWGQTLVAVIRNLEPGAVSHLVISQLAGGFSQATPGIQGHELARNMAAHYPGSSVTYLHAPSIVDTEEIQQAIMRDSSVRAALDAAAASDLAVVGIGEMQPGATLLRHHVSAEDRIRLLNAGAIGSMNTRFYDSEGRATGDLDARTIAITWEQLRAIPTVVAISAGVAKVEAIRGALRSGCIQILVTDQITATLLLRPATSEPDH